MKNHRSCIICVTVLAVLAVGCEGSETSATTGTHSASHGDGSTNSTATPSQIVHVVDRYGDPIAGVPVVANDQEGAVTAVDKTDENGMLSIDVPTGGSVSVFQAETTSLSVSTVVEPPPGTIIRFPIWAPWPKSASLGDPTTYEIAFASVPAEAYHVTVGHECTIYTAWPDQSPSMNDHGCTDAATRRLVAVAVDASREKIYGWGQAVAETKPGGVVPVTIGLDHETVAATQVEVTGLPSGTSEVKFQGGLLGGSYYFQSTSVEAPPSSSASAIVSIPNILDLGRGLNVTVSVSTETGWSRVWKNGKFSAETQPASWVLAADGFAWVLTGPADVSSPAHPSFAWSTAEPQDADCVRVSSTWAVGVGSVYYSVLLPPDHETSWRMPDVPDELSSFRPSAASVFGNVEVEYSSWEDVDGYADALAGLQADTDWRMSRSAQAIAP